MGVQCDMCYQMRRRRDMSPIQWSGLEDCGLGSAQRLSNKERARGQSEARGVIKQDGVVVV